MNDSSAPRTDYRGVRLEAERLPDDPLDLLREWTREALAGEEAEPAAAVLSTEGNGQPSGRVVLVRGIDQDGLRFYTNYESRKARELEENPAAALTIFWPLMHRQIHVEGPAVRLDAAESDRYFASRPRPSQIGAWASPQSTVITSRSVLDEKFAEMEEEFEGAEVTRPPNWGGFRVVPRRLEFWQGQPSRLHDRIRYVPVEEPASDRETVPRWRRERLAP